MEWWLLAFLAVTSFIHFTTQPMDNTFTGRYTSLGHRGLGYGTSFALSFGVGSFAAWAGGLVADASGDRLQYVWLMLAAVAGFAASSAAARAPCWLTVSRDSPAPGRAGRPAADGSPRPASCHSVPSDDCRSRARRSPPP